MIGKPKKAKRKGGADGGELPGGVRRLRMIYCHWQRTGAESRWNRSRKRRISLRMDTEVVDWFKSKGPGAVSGNKLV
jgi:hypothetical protein